MKQLRINIYVFAIVAHFLGWPAWPVEALDSASAAGEIVENLDTLRSDEPVNSSPVFDMAVSADGSILATAHEHSFVVLWELKRLTSKRVIDGFGREHSPITQVLFAPNAKQLVVAGAKGLIEMRSVKNGNRLAIFQGIRNGQSTSLAMSPDGRHIMSISPYDFVIEVWEARSMKLLWRGTAENGDLWRGAFSKDGRRILTVGNKLIKWDVESGSKLESAKQLKGEFIKSVSDSQILLHVTPKRWIEEWDINMESKQNTFKGAKGYGVCFDISDDEKFLICGTKDKSIAIWRRRDKELLTEFEAHSDVVTSVIFLDGTSRFVSSSLDGTIKIWRLAR